MFKKLTGLLIIYFSLLIPFSASADYDYVPGELIVKYKKSKLDLKTDQGKMKASVISRERSLSSQENFSNLNISLLKIQDGLSVSAKIKELSADPNVEFVEPNYRRQLQVIDTNDFYRSYLWGLDNYGQNIGGQIGVIDSDIDAVEAWQKSTGTDVIVAVIDLGVAYDHPDLQANMWDGTNCKDDLGNYLGDCLHGYDFADDDKNPLPSMVDQKYNHGTHVAGTIAAIKNNNVGIIGVAPAAKIMALRFSLNVASEVRAINFAIQNGAKIINASFGGASFSSAERSAIESFGQSGGLYIAAASNDSNNNDQTPYYPASYNLDNIIAVAASDNQDNLATFSNYGKNTVDVTAPGHYIYSTVTSESNLFTDWLNGVLVPDLPAGFEKGGDNNSWSSGENATYGKIISSTLGSSYASSTNNYITSPAYNLSGTASAYVSFTAWCNTEYNGEFDDYLVLEYSNDGGLTFEEGLKVNEEFLAILNGSNTNSPLGAASFIDKVFLPTGHLVDNFKFRWRWVTDSDDDSGDGDLRGCFISSFNLKKLSTGVSSTYAYYSGTSMSTPHVAGLAALISALRPDLSNNKIKEIILNTGDLKTALVDITVSGRRVNAAKALNFTSLADKIFPTNLSRGGSLPISFNTDGLASSTVWIAPATSTSFSNSSKMSSAQGLSGIINTPTEEGVYKFFVMEESGLLSPHSLADLTINNSKPNVPIFSEIAEDGVINFLEKDNFLVKGTADLGADLFLNISDGSNQLEKNIKLATTDSAFEFLVDSREALPQAFSGETLFLSLTAYNDLGNSSLATTSVVYDEISPVITKTETLDFNKNGKIDAIKITFNKDMATSSLVAAEFDVSSYTNEFFRNDLNLEANEAILTFTEQLEFDSADLPTLFYTGSSTKDVGENYLQTQTISALDKVSPVVLTWGDGLSDFSITGTSTLFFSEILTTESKLKIESLLNRLTGGVLNFLWDAKNLEISSATTTTFDHDVIVRVYDQSGNLADLKLIDSFLTENQIEVNDFGYAVISTSTPELVITNANQVIEVVVDLGIDNPIINFSSLLDENKQVSAPEMLLRSQTSELVVEVASSTIISSASSSWNGLLTAPKAKIVNIPSQSGVNRSLILSFSVGEGNDRLSFNKGVRIFIAGQAGKKVAYFKADGTFVEITNNCSNDSQAVADNLAFGTDCKIDVGQNLVIWTKHFTDFAVYSQTTISTGGGGGGGGGGASITYCSEVNYSSWQECLGKMQFRTVLSSSPVNCSLSLSQQLALTRECVTLEKPVATSSVEIISEPEVIIDEEEKKDSLLLRIIEVINEEKKLLAKIDSKLVNKLLGRILLQVETRGQAWYLDSKTATRYYLANGPSAYEALRRFGLGIKNSDLLQIPIAPTSALPDNYQVVKKTSQALTNRLKGKILLQVESRGEAWYVNPADGYRYYLANGEEAYRIMRELSLGINNVNIRKIPVYKN